MCSFRIQILCQKIQNPRYRVERLGKTKNKDELRNQPNYVNTLGVDEANKKLQEQKERYYTKLINFGFNNTILAEISEYIFDREF